MQISPLSVQYFFIFFLTEMWRSEGTKQKTKEILKCKTDGYYEIFHLQFTPLVIWSKFLMRLLSSFPSGRWAAEVGGQWTLLTWLIRPVPSSIQDQCWDKADCAGWSAPSQGNIWWDKTFLWPDYRNPVDFSYTLIFKPRKYLEEHFCLFDPVSLNDFLQNISWPRCCKVLVKGIKICCDYEKTWPIQSAHTRLWRKSVGLMHSAIQLLTCATTEPA